MAQKPQHMTSLYGTEMVRKDHPRIQFRGALDTLHAQAVLCAAYLREAGALTYARDVDEIADGIYAVLMAECTQKPMRELQFCGMTAEEIHDHSHFPKKYYGVEHFTPESSMGTAMAQLNLLRTRIRDVEREMYACFGEEREDINYALNRLSSYAYCLMCRLRAEQEGTLNV